MTLVDSSINKNSIYIEYTEILEPINRFDLCVNLQQFIDKIVSFIQVLNTFKHEKFKVKMCLHINKVLEVS